MSKWSLRLAGLMVVSLSSVVSARDVAYVNETFRFAVDYPDRWPTCRVEPGTQDTGILIFLDAGPSDCVNKASRPYVSINGSFNASDEKSAEDLKDIYCENNSSTVYGRLNGLHRRLPVSCEFMVKGGSVISLMGQEPKVDTDLSEINYSIRVFIPTSTPNAFESALPIILSFRLLRPGVLFKTSARERELTKELAE